MVSSPLRYPGGKSKLFKFFCDIIKANDLYNCSYCEPYAGGAGLAIKLLVNGFVKEISLNDIDPGIYAFWTSALYDTDNFCGMIENTPITIEEWLRQKAIWKNVDAANQLQLGFSTYFLNRTSRSGIIEGAGPIGGYKQDGKWKIDVRLIKDRQIENIKLLSNFREQISISNEDALKYIKNKLSKQETLTYLDPPYYVKGSKLYKNFYNHEDHKNISLLLRKSKSRKWILSYDDVPQIRDLYHDFIPTTYYLNYSAGNKTKGKEVIYVSDCVCLPDEENKDSNITITKDAA
ncbi:hypothetical protein HK13_06655 [Acetobacter indonesiensis]|uniref:DNA adenine methylase n=1 Tax=Acetobacter indonesiensis TaxID=104101 RepID=UPI000A3BDF10|nr:DNA adenine methylase [Acetobacter indonesiensis]OUI94133.1 hypothetical protein HK13_06655 [Acetobacter indonesiensis]